MPVFRSNPFNALPVSLPVAGPPNALKSLEQAQSVFAASSAKTPKIEREPNAPGWTNTVLSAVRGLTRTIPPFPTRPTKRAPSEVDVMLSGNACVPGTAIDSEVDVMLSGNAFVPGTAIDSTLPCARESTMGTHDQNVRCEAGGHLIAQKWTAADRASCRISAFLVCFRFQVFNDPATLYLGPLPGRVLLILCLPGGRGRRI